jgi:CRP/FNR family transcriptional regulator, cyclic AMP receptor protein
VTPILGTGGATRGVATPPPASAPAGQARTVRRGEALFDVGSPADSLYRIESGLVALTLPLRSGRTRILSLAGPGEYVGALAPGMRDHEERAEALSPTVTAVAYWRAHVDSLLEPALFDALHRHAARLRRSLEDADRPVAARVALALLDLGDRYGHVAEDGATRLTLPLTHDHLAAMVGAARETTSGAVAELRTAGLVSGTRGRYRFVAERLRGALPLLDLRD